MERWREGLGGGRERREEEEEWKDRMQGGNLSIPPKPTILSTCAFLIALEEAPAFPSPDGHQSPPDFQLFTSRKMKRARATERRKNNVSPKTLLPQEREHKLPLFRSKP